MHQHFSGLVRLIALVYLMAMIPVSNADTLESLLMPGPVIKGHAEYEDDCSQCHDRADKDKQGQLCMQCHDHKNILNDVRTKKGFHGRLPSSIRTKCSHCHKDHEGRDAKIVLLNPMTFDHSKTDFRLKGMHTKTNCKSCHKPKKKYAEAPRDCYSCHQKSDVHDEKNGKKCGDCHTPNTWKQSDFDHDKKTDFPLKGVHKETNCTSCHFNQKYKDTPKNCISCM